MASTWYAGAADSPAANAVIVDAGQLSATQGTITVQTMVNATVAATFMIEHVAADGATILHAQEISLTASAQTPFGGFTIIFADNERIRIRMKALVIGRVSCSIFLS